MYFKKYLGRELKLNISLLHVYNPKWYRDVIKHNTGCKALFKTSSIVTVF